MFSRLSGLANTVIHELSGDGDDLVSSAEMSSKESDSVEKFSEDHKEQLAQYQQLISELKELIQRKDLEIEQKDAQLKEERDISGTKLAKLKLQAKAKVTNLNKQIEELRRAAADQVIQDGGVDLHTCSQSESKPCGTLHEQEREKLQETIAELKRQGHQDEECISELTSSLHDCQGQINELKRQLDESKASITDHASQLPDSQDTVAELSWQLHENENINKLTKQLQESQASVIELTEQLQENWGNVIELQRQLQESQGQVTDVTRRLQESQDQVTEVTRQLQESRDQVTEVTRQLQESRDQVTEVTRQLHESQDQVTRQLHESQDQVTEVTRQLHESQASVIELREQLQENQASVNELTRQFLESQNQVYKGTTKDSQNQVTEVNRQLHESQDQDTEVTRELYESQDQDTEVTRELYESQDQDTEVTRELYESQDQDTEVTRELYESQDQDTEITREFYESQDQDTEVTRELHESQDQVTEVNRELHECQNQVTEVTRKQHESQDQVTEVTRQLQESQDQVNEVTRKQHESQDQVTKVTRQLQESQDQVTEVIKQLLESQNTITNLTKQLKESQDEVKEVRRPFQDNQDHSTVNQLCNSIEKQDTEGQKNVSVEFSIMEDLREKQLSVLLMDLRDTKEELEQLTKKVTKEDTLDTRGSWMSEEVDHVTDRTVSQAEDTANTYLLQKGTVQEISLTATEEQSSLMHETTIHVTEHWSESHLETTTQVTQTKNMDLKTNDQILSLKQQVSELQVQLEALGIEKDSLAVKLHAMLQEHKITESLQRTDRELTDTEKQMTMYESQNMLAEQVSSLENESRSKDLKIMVLQEDLDKLNALLSDNQTQLKEKESDLKNITESLNQSQSKERQLSEAFAANESVLVSVQNLISDKTKEIESLQSCLAEKDEQVAEISHSLSDKIVHLNEEKHSMKKEINNLKEKLRSATQGKNLELEQSIQRKERKSELQNMLELTQRVEEEMQLEGVQSQNSENKGLVSHKIEQQTQENLQHQEMLQNVVREQNDLLVPLPSVCHEHLQHVELVKRLQTAQEEQKILTDNEDVGSVQDQLKHCRTENEQLKKKLQVALANRKELLKKVSVLEKEQEKTNASLLATTDFLFNENDESIPQKVLEKNITEVFLKQQLLERDAELEAVKQELMQNKLSVERLEILVKEMTHELAEKSNLSGHVNTAQMENLCVIKTSESQNLTSDLIHSSDHENNRLKLESIILNLEQDKENLQKKVQEALNSRRDTIKKAQEKDRHHREQLKQHKEEFNLLQEKCEELQRSQKVLIGQCYQEKGTQTIDLYPAGRPQNSEAEKPASVLSTMISPIEQNVQDSNWGNDWTELLNIEDKDAINHNSSQGAEMLEDYRTHLKYLQTQKTELEFRTVCLERDLAGCLEEILNLQETVVNVTGSLKNEREKCQESDIQAATMKAALEDQLQELELETKNMREMLNLKNNEIKNLRLMLEERNTVLEGLKISVQEKKELITSLKCQLECQVKELALSSHKLEMQQNKQDDDAQEAKSKQQLQRKLQAALISRKELLNEIKTLKSELGTTHKYKEELNNRLQAAETSINHLNEEKHQMLENFSKQKDERYKLIEEVDKRLLEIQSLETSCESLKLALEGITQEKAILENELKSIKDEHVSETSEYKEKISEMKKEYETLLQSYENVSNETDRMKRAMETVRQEKQEILNKLTAVESTKAELEKQIEEAEAEIQNMKEKMRKFAKSKQQKILELEEENEKLRGDMEPYDKQRQLLNTTKAENAELRTKLETLRSENQALAAQIESLHLEKVTEADVISSQLQSIEATFQDVLEEDVPGSQDNLNVLCPPSTNTEEPEGNDLLPQVLDQDKQTQEDPKQSVHDFMNETEILKTQLLALKDEKTKTELKLAAALDEIGNMQKRVSELETNCEKIKKEVDKVIKQKEIVEFEKDELEERLMNQLAELNGSIGNYQQDAVEHQMRNESLQRQLRDLQLQLEEEKRQLERQRAEAMSQVQKDYVEKLKSVYEGEKGKKTQAKKLHELLKEKQQEIWHLQKDCINYQETISGLERVNKALVFKQSESEKEMATANERIAKAMNATEQARAELASLHVQLDDTQSEAARVLAENMKLKEDVQALRENIVSALKRKEDDLEKRLEQERDKHLKDVGNMQEQVNLLLLEKKRLEASIKDLQLTLDTKTKEMKDLEGNLTQNLAKLAAFSRSMCSLQDDRDRVIEESRKWDLKFTEAMQKKDKELTEKEKTLEAAKNELREITSQMEALHTQVSRLERENQELMIAWQTEAESSVQTQKSLQEEKEDLSVRLEGERKLHLACREELRLKSLEATRRLTQIENLEEKYSQSNAERDNLLGSTKQLELEVQEWKLLSEQFQSDLEASKSLTEKLRLELEQKQQDAMWLLSSRDEAVSAAVKELRDLQAAESQALEERLKEAEQERRRIQEKLAYVTAQMSSSEEEAGRNKVHLEALTKSMCSLQNERERMLSEYQQLEQTHLSSILAKDALIQEAAAESNELREELRNLRSRTDDLNAQNAKLDAQLAQYRQDLKELISLKDSQLKQLLGEKLQHIERLQNESSAQAQQLKEEKERKEALQQELAHLQDEVQSMRLYVTQLQSTQEALQLEDKRLREELAQLEGEVVRGREESSQLQADAALRVQRAEQELSRKLQSMQHDTGILRNETETAEERVAELARDLMQAEQRLLLANEENAAIRARLQAFEGSMRSLQDSHDLVNEELNSLRKQQEKLASLSEELSFVSAERDRLRQEMKQLSNNSQLEPLSKDLSSLQRIQRSPGKEEERNIQASADVKAVTAVVGTLPEPEEEVNNLRSQLSDALTHMHQKELKIQQLNSKLSQVFQERNTLSLQLRGSSQNLREAQSQCATLQRQIQEVKPNKQFVQELQSCDSAPGAPQERKEPQQELRELQERYLQMKQQNIEAEQVKRDLEQQLREERERSDERVQEMKETVMRLQSHRWSSSEGANELSLLIEPQEIMKSKARSSSLRRLLHHIYFYRTRTPLLFGLYLLTIHVLLLLCLSGHL